MIAATAPAPRRARTGVGLVTGFLGSGKTTLLSHVLRDPSMHNTAVIVNEFGSVSIDHLLVREVRDNVIELKNGCLCCSIQGDLLMTLRDLHTRRVLGDVSPFDYVVVETTGLADPVPLAQTFTSNRPLQTVYALDVVVCTVDGQQAESTMAGHPVCRSQIAFADVLLLTKSDCLEPAQQQRMQDGLREQNPSAQIHRVTQGRVDPGLLFRRALFDARPITAAAVPQRHEHELGHEHGAPRAASHADSYSTHVFASARPLSYAGTLTFLNHLTAVNPSKVLRIKGLAAFAGQGERVALIQAVQQRFAPIQWFDAWPDADHSSRLVVIGRELDWGQLEQDFRAVCLS